MLIHCVAPTTDPCTVVFANTLDSISRQMYMPIFLPNLEKKLPLDASLCIRCFHTPSMVSRVTAIAIHFAKSQS